MAAAPAQKAIAEAQFIKAKALLLRILAICALILVIAFVIFLLWQLFSTQIPKLWSEKNQQNEQIITTAKDDIATESNKDTSNTTSTNGSAKTGTEITTSAGASGVVTTTSSEKEEKLREILKQKTTQDPATDAKTTRPNVQNKKMAERLFNPNSTIGKFTSSKNNTKTSLPANQS